MPSAVVLIANGTEEMEFTIAYDTLVRAGIQVESAYVGPHTNADPLVVTCSRGLKVVPDTSFQIDRYNPQRGNYDLLVIPGGAKGAETMSEHPAVQEAVRAFLDNGKWVGMICAGSLAALTSNLPKQPITSHPSVQTKLESHFEYSEEPVVVSGNLVTSRGPGTAFPFALKLVELLLGKEKREEVSGPMVFPEGTPL